MKKALIKIVYTIVVFIVSLLVIGHFTNVETVDMTAQMGAPTFPTVTLEEEGKMINTLHGYASEMDVSHMRGTILPIDSTRRVNFSINTYGQDVTGLRFEVRQISGRSLVENSEITDLTREDDIIRGGFQIKDLIDAGQEYMLVILANLGDQTVRFYSRIIWSDDDNMYHAGDKINFALHFSELTFNKAGATEELTKYIESNKDGDNTNYSHVNINSSYDQVTWGDLDIVSHTEPKVSLWDIHSQTGIIGLEYQLVQRTEDGTEKTYNVKEAYRIRYTSERMYLLNFDRRMNYIFSADSSDIVENTINLWISEPDITLKESDGGTAVAFISEDRLYVYNSTDNKIALVFGFYNDEYTDERVTLQANTIKVLNIDEAGNVRFSVSGYMNRGNHEGTVGTAVYGYDSRLNTIEELAYIPSTLSEDIVRAFSDKILFVSTGGQLYFRIDSEVYMIDLDSRDQKKLIDNLADERYSISKSESIIAWQAEDYKTVHIMNLSNQGTSEITADDGDLIRVLGFMGEDLVYGLVHESDVHVDRMGMKVYGMYSVRIVDSTGSILENYNPSEGVVTGTEIDGNIIRLSKASWNPETGLYDELIDDQIMSTLKVEKGSNNIVTAATERYKTIVEISLKSNVKKKSLIVQTPNMTLYEGSREVVVSAERDADTEPYYYVYGLYGLIDVYDDPAAAISAAYSAPGSVTNDDNQYVWIRGNLSTSNQIMYITNLADEWGGAPQSNSTGVCLDLILQHRGISINVDALLEQGDSVADILRKSLVNTRILELDGCPMEAMLYYVNQDIPVMATLNDGNSLLIIGFNDLNTVLLEPSTGQVYKLGRGDTASLLEENGNHFITYLPNTEY